MKLVNKQREREWWLLLGVVLAFSVYTTYELTLVFSVPELVVARSSNEAIKSELQGATERLDRTRASLSVAVQEAKVIRGANRLLREEDVHQQSELVQLRADLEFYRRLTRTGGSQSGLTIYTAELVATESPLVYRFQIALTHNIRRAAIVAGKVLIDLEGTLDDRLVTLYWSQLTDGNKPQPTFRFKYFQELEGYLALPENFRPTQLVITLEADNQRKPISRHFDWREMLEATLSRQRGVPPRGSFDD